MQPRERVDLTLEILQRGLRPTVERTMTAARGRDWIAAMRRADSRQSDNGRGGYSLDDPRFLLRVINADRAAFGPVLRPPSFRLAAEAFQAATDHVHFLHVDEAGTLRTLDGMARLLELAGAHPEAAEIRQTMHLASTPDALPMPTHRTRAYPFIAGMGCGNGVALGCVTIILLIGATLLAIVVFGQ